MIPVELPWDVWINVLSFLDSFSTLNNFAQTSRRNHQIVEQSSNLLHYQISANLRFIGPYTFGSASTLYASESERDNAKQKQNSELEHLLSKAIFNQMTMMKSSFDEVRTWKHFAKARMCIERNWDLGKGSWTTIVRPTRLPASRLVDQVKFNPEFNYWAVIEAHSGVVEIFSQLASGYYRRWRATPGLGHMPPPGDLLRYGCIESSGPFVVTTIRDNTLHVWKRIEDAYRRGALPAEDERWPYNHVVHGEDAKNTFEECDSSPMFRLHHCLIMPRHGTCFKARAPYLVVGSYGKVVYVWNLETGTQVEEYDIDASGRIADDVGCVDFDSRLIFIDISKKINIFDRATQQYVGRIPPEPVASLKYYADKTHDVVWPSGTRGTQYDQPRGQNRASCSPSKQRKKAALGLYRQLSQWTSVRCDHINGHLVALSYNGLLIWTPNYRQTCSTTHSVSNRNDFVVLDLAGSGSELCLENGRAVFNCYMTDRSAAKTAKFQSLYALELKSWTNHADFVASPPKLTILSKIIPSLVPISHLEMDSCAVYATALDVRCVVELGEAWKTLQDHEVLYPLGCAPTWFNLDGKLLYSNEHLSQPDDISPATLKELARCWAIWEYQRNSLQVYQRSSIIAYSLLPTEGTT